MPDQPRRDKPQLPDLRRFRFGADGPGQARESTGEPEPAAWTDSAVPTPVEQHSVEPTATSGPAGRPTGFDTVAMPNDDTALDDPDRLLAETDRLIPSSGHESLTDPATMRSRADSAGPVAAGPVPPAFGAAGAQPPPGGPIAVSAPDEPPSRSRLPMVIAAIAAVVVIGLVVWLITRPGDDDQPPTDDPASTSESAETRTDDQGTGEPDDDGDGDQGGGLSQEPEPPMSGGPSGGPSAGPRQGGTVGSADMTSWAMSMCSAMKAYEAVAVPIAVDASQGGSNAELAEDAATLSSELGDLQSALADAEEPDDDQLAALHDAVRDEVDSSLDQLDAVRSGSPIGAPMNLSTAIENAAYQPGDTLAEGIMDLHENTRDELGAVADCQLFGA